MEGIIGIAAPVRDSSRQVIGSLGVALPTSQGSQKEILHIVGLLTSATQKISSDLGYMKI